MKKIVLIFAALAIALTASAQKKVSILGDSYSTFKDCIPKHYACWYPHKNNDVAEAEQTWWRQFLAETGYVLEKNNSWSGSTICNTGYDGKDYSNRAFFTRVNMLGDPDIILIFGGTNDSWAGAPIGEYKFRNWNRTDLYSFRPALAYLLSQARMLYPDADIYFMLNSELSDEVNESTFKICRKYKVPVIALQDVDKQSKHPSIAGMTSISRQVAEFIRSQE